MMTATMSRRDEDAFVEPSLRSFVLLERTLESERAEHGAQIIRACRGVRRERLEKRICRFLWRGAG